MQFLKNLESPSLAIRREGFMKDIRNVQREEFKKRARFVVITRNTNEELSSLIEVTQKSIQSQQLQLLIRYANQHNHKAVGHLGNLIIDGVIKVSQLERFSLEPDFHPHWLWLIQVLVQNSYCTIELLRHCIKTISPTRNEQSVKHALTILYKITSSNMFSSFLLRQQNVLLSILNSTFRQDSASKVGYLLVYQLIQKEEGLAKRFSEGILRQRLVKSIKNGLNSAVFIIRTDSLRILKELAIRDVFFYQFHQRHLQLIKSSDFNTNAELYLEYLMYFSQLGAQEQIIRMIDGGLLIEFGHWKRIYQNDDEEKASLIIQICRSIKERTCNMGHLSKGIQIELNRLDLLSFKAVIEL